MKKLLRGAWQAVTKKNHAQSRSANEVESASQSRLHDGLAAVDAAFDRAQILHQAGNLTEAQAAYRSILARMPEHAPTLHFLGVSYGQAGDLAEAERLIRKSIEIRESSEYFSNLALVLDKQGKQGETVSALCNALRLAPDNIVMHGNLGDLYVGYAQYADAERAYRNALALQPDDVDTNFKLAGVLTELKCFTEAVGAYRRALSLRPEFADASNNLGNLLKGMRRYSEAEDAYKQTLILQPGAAAVYCNLGQLLQETGRYDESEAAIRRAAELQPELAGAHFNLGILCAARGRRSEAEVAIRRGLELQPDNVDAHNNLGNVLMEMDRCAEAEAAYRQALMFNPDHADAWDNLGLLLRDAGKFDEAEAAYRKALSVKPDRAITHNNLANLLYKKNRTTEAEAAYRHALALQPDYADACSNLGALLQENGRMAEAELFHRKALQLKPDAVAVHNNFGCLLLAARRFAEAEGVFNHALVLQPDLADAYAGLGNIFKETARYAEAEVAYRRAIALEPKLAGAHGNLGFLLQWSERFDEAEAAFRQAVALSPESDLAQYNLALFCLAQKRFCEGWMGYERRWKIKDFNSVPSQHSQAQWQGETLAGGSILVWQEQGVGDIVLYAGMIHDLTEQAAHVIVECEPRLVPLLARSYPQARIVERSDPPDIATLKARWNSPIGSLGRWLRTRKEDFSRQGAYLSADANQVAVFRQRYHALGRGPVVGISWRSNNEKVGHSKSMSLADWAPLLALQGAIFVNLQYGDCEEELSRLKRDTGVTVYHDNTVNSLKDLDGFAAQVAAMDLVISTSNSTVHFAGALGVSVWTLLPKGDGLLWYWFSEGDDSLWYPSMRLFRQDSIGDWSGLLVRVAEAFRDFLIKFR